MEEYIHKVNIDDFLGLDLTSSDLKRGDNFLTGGKNFDIDDSGDLVTRKGYSDVRSDIPLINLPEQSANFFGLNSTPAVVAPSLYVVEGTSKKEIVCLSATKAFTVTTNTAALTNTGAIRRVIVDFNTTSNLWFMEVRLESSGAILGSINFPQSITSLTTFFQTTIGTFNFVPTEATNPVVSFQAINALMGVSGVHSFSYYVTKDIETGYSSYSGLSFSGKSTTALINNNLYVSTEDGKIVKYDGKSIYRAGLPKPSFIVNATSGNNIASTTEEYAWKIRLGHRDNAGNYIYSPFSDIQKTTLTSTQFGSLVVNFNSFLGGSSGYKTRVGLGMSPSFNIFRGVSFNTTASISNSLAVGDLVFWPAYSDYHVTYGTVFSSGQALGNLNNKWWIWGRVTAVNGAVLSITPEIPDTPSYQDNMQSTTVSNGMWVEVYRTRKKTIDPGLGTFYQIGLAAIASTSSITFADFWFDSDNNMLGNIIAPSVNQDFGTMAPACALLSSYRGRLIAAGDRVDGNLVHFSEAGFPENFPTSTNSMSLDTEYGDSVTGISGNQDALIAFKESTIFRASGDLGSAFSVDRIYTGTGCVSHNSITDLGEQRTSFLTKKGIYQIIRSSTVAPLVPIQGISGETSDRLSGYFRNLSVNGFLKYISYAQAQTFPEEQKVIITIPIRPDDGKVITSAADFTSFDYLIYDFKRGYYSLWDSIGGFGGFRPIQNSSKQDLVFFRKNAGSLVSMCVLAKSGGLSDYVDHNAAINTEVLFNWMNLGSPDVLKKFLRINLWLIGSSSTSVATRSESDWLPGVFTTLADVSTSEPNVKIKIADQRARALRVSLVHSVIKKYLRLSGFTLEVSAPYRQRVKE